MRNEPKLLEHDSDRLPPILVQLCLSAGSQFVVPNFKPALSWPIQSSQEIEQGRFAGTGATEYRDRFVLRDFKTSSRQCDCVYLCITSTRILFTISSARTKAALGMRHYDHVWNSQFTILEIVVFARKAQRSAARNAAADWATYTKQAKSSLNTEVK